MGLDTNRKHTIYRLCLVVWKVKKKKKKLKGMVYLSGQWDLTALYCKECVASAATFVKF